MMNYLVIILNKCGKFFQWVAIDSIEGVVSIYQSKSKPNDD